MTKTLTEQWKNGELKDGSFYIERFGKHMMANCIGQVLYLENHDVIWSPNTVEIIAPVPSYRELYGENDGNRTTGVFTVLKIIKRDIENAQKRRSLTDLEFGIKSQVVSLLKKWGVK